MVYYLLTKLSIECECGLFADLIISKWPDLTRSITTSKHYRAFKPHRHKQTTEITNPEV